MVYLFKSSKKFAVSVVLILLTSLLFISTAGAQEFVEVPTSESKKIVTNLESLKILEDYLNTSYSLNASDYSIELEEGVYDISGKKIAKYYVIKSINGKEYFAIISNDKEYSTVFAGGENVEQILNLGNGNVKHYFVGGYTLVKANDHNQVIEYVKSKNSELTTEDVKNTLSIQKNPNAVKQWDAALLENISTNAVGSYGSKLLPNTIFSQFDSNVTPLNRNSSCGPSSMAVILQYWHDSRSKGKLQVYNAGYTTKGAFINHLYQNRGGGLAGMSVNGVASGLQNEAIARGYSATTSTFNNFFSYTNEIINNRPVAVKFDKYFTLFEPNADYSYNYHWTAGVGYVYSASSTLLRVQTVSSNSYIRDIDYNSNSAIISMVGFTIN